MELHTSPDGLALPATAQAGRQRTVFGAMAGGWNCYVAPGSIVALDVWNAGSGFRVLATLSVTDRDGNPLRMPMSPVVETEADAHAAMDALVADLFLVARTVVRDA